jgi:hypothetical protein
MAPAASLFRSASVSRSSSALLAISAALLSALATGCGTHMSGPITPTPQNTSATIMVTSTANDQLSEFNLTFNSLTLTSQSGKSASVFATPQQAEFIHLNGTAEPLLTVSIPQDTYTAATATAPPPQISCVIQLPGEIETDEFQSSVQPTVTLTLHSPIRVTGTAMGLLLNLQVSPSVVPSACPLTPTSPTVNPAFTVTPVTPVSSPTNFQNGKMSSLVGQVSAINSMTNSFTVAAADGPTWVVNSDNNTVYQGVAAFSTLTVGMPVDMDLTIQSDGSLLAMRVAVPEANPSNLSELNGPLMQIAASVPSLLASGREVQGLLFPGDRLFGAFIFNFNDSVAQISPRFSNLQSLPFAPAFTTANMVPGQNASFSTHATALQGGPAYVPATTITLMPQTLNGTITATGSGGNFTTYTISLAPYDLLPNLAVQPGQNTLLTNPNTVIVYVDADTQMLNTKQLAVGGVFRFNGLLFNDNGTARMDCAQISDGVPE